MKRTRNEDAFFPVCSLKLQGNTWWWWCSVNTNKKAIRSGPIFPVIRVLSASRAWLCPTPRLSHRCPSTWTVSTNSGIIGQPNCDLPALAPRRTPFECEQHVNQSQI